VKLTAIQNFDMTTSSPNTKRVYTEDQSYRSIRVVIGSSCCKGYNAITDYLIRGQVTRWFPTPVVVNEKYRLSNLVTDIARRREMSIRTDDLWSAHYHATSISLPGWSVRKDAFNTQAAVAPTPRIEILLLVFRNPFT